VIQSIPVARMLREAVTTPYLNLVTRPTGAAVRGRIESVLATSEWETALLDFSDVVLLDLSCADEVVAKLVRMAQERLGRIVALRGLDEHLWESIHAVLEHQQLAVAVLCDTSITLLGCVPADVHRLFATLESTTPLSVDSLAQRLAWTVSRTGDALETALALGVARRSGPGYVRIPLA
jgi:hypothetical protein